MPDPDAPNPAAGADAGRPSVFVSYARADRARVAPLVERLEGAGLEVWWDGMIAGGEAFARTIEARLDAVDAVIVVWSATSVQSDWVRDEAAHGRDRGRFVAVTIDGTPPPLGFRQYHALDLSGWTGGPQDKPFLDLLHGVDKVRGAPVPERPRPAPGAPAPPRPAAPGWTRRRTLGAGLGATALAGIGGGLLWWQGRVADQLANSIAVLPFRNLNDKGGDDWFPDGLTDEIRVRLTSDAHIAVAAPTSSNLFRQQSTDAREVARKLGVGWLLEGAVRRADDALRITVSLINGGTGLSQWSQNFEQSAKDVFDIERDVATAIATAVAGQAGQAVRQSASDLGGTTLVAAHDLYLQAKALYAQDRDEATYRQAAAIVDQALAIDPGYARAHLLRAKILLVIRNSFTAGGAEQVRLSDLAFAAERRALALAPGLAEGYVVLGYSLLADKLDYRLPGPLYDRARKMAPGDPEIARAHAHLLYRMGRNAEAVAAIAIARRLDVLNPIVFRVSGLINFVGGRDAAARADFTQALALDPAVPLARAGLGDILLKAGQSAAAKEAFAREPSSSYRLVGLACAAHQAGDRTGAQDALRQLREQGDMVLYQQAQVLAWTGDAAGALATLDKAYALRDSGLLAIGIDFKFDTLRDRPPFRRLMARMGLAPA